VNVQTSNDVLDDILVVKDFSDVFPEELHGQLVDKEIQFVIDVMHGTQPISKTPYISNSSR